jgi:hypothetical protein
VDKIWYMRCTKKLGKMVTTDCSVDATLHRTPGTFGCPIWVKSDTRDFHQTLLNVCEFTENVCRSGHTCLRNMCTANSMATYLE